MGRAIYYYEQDKRSGNTMQMNHTSKL